MRWLWAVLVVIAACGDEDPSPDAGKPAADATADAGFPDAAAADAASIDSATPDADPIDSGNPDAIAPDAGRRCETLSPGVKIIDRSVVLCSGTVEASIVVRTSDVRIECDGTMLDGEGNFGTVERPTSGFLLENVQNVQIIGCAARGFRYGLIAVDSAQIEIRSARFDHNFHDPNAGWVQDSVQGGGVRFQNTHSSTIADSSLRENWNAIELRRSNRNTVVNNVADRCSNTGVTVVASDNNRIVANNMSWAIRGENLSYPNNWYRVDTRDSAGIILDAASRFNLIRGNNFTFGGDGVFIRSVIGACATHNIVQDNDTSFSPHNAIECWCDWNQFIDNLANDSDYGLWLGGSDAAIVRGNIVERNLTDGISIQIGENRGTVIEGNTIRDNGRTGILLTGREIQSWHPLTHQGANLANSSGILVQQNTFGQNGPCVPFNSCDVFVAASRLVLLGSNCTDNNMTARATLGAEAEAVIHTGACGASTQAPRGEPADFLATEDVPVAIDVNARDPEGAPLSYFWLVQQAGPRFVPPVLPAPLLIGPGPARREVTFPEPGLWEVSVAIDDALFGSIGRRITAVLPSGGSAVSVDPADWSWTCTTPGCVTMLSADNGVTLLRRSLRVETDEAFPFSFHTDISGDFSQYTRLGGFFRSENRNSFGWQGEFPAFVLHSSNGGTITYVPSTNLLPTLEDEWVWIVVPLAGGPGWTRTEAGGNLSDVTRLEIRTDTWDFGRYNVTVDALTFF